MFDGSGQMYETFTEIAYGFPGSEGNRKLNYNQA